MATLEHTKVDPHPYLLQRDHSEKGTVKFSGVGTYPAGTVLGRVSDGGGDDGKWRVFDDAAGNGTENPRAVLMEEVTTTGIDEEAHIWVLREGRTRAAKTMKWDGGTPVALTIHEGDALYANSHIRVEPTTEYGFHDNE